MILSIDTCGPLGSVALARLDGELTLLAQTEIPGKTYSAQLIPAIHSLLSAHNVALARIATIVVTNGPGSFTGIRIGLSTAKGLAEAHSIPLLAVSRLAVLAHMAQTRKPDVNAAALDASRGEFYFGDFSSPASRESLLPSEPFRTLAAAQAQNLSICEASVHALAPTATLVDPPTAADALRCALPRLRSRAFDDPVTLDGNYLRRSDAEIFSQPNPPPRPGSRPQP
jgi:tRNA threonylcarbamoyladenosine biosynthesis protein TsaB